MKDPKKQYEKKREQIRRDKNISELEKSSRHFGNWIDYVFSTVESREKESLKYQAEKIRINT
jgi:hypothetical protein